MDVPLDSRPAADYCKQFTEQAGYVSRSTHNGDVEGLISSLSADDLFYFTGHGVGACPGSVQGTTIVHPAKDTAAGLEMWANPDSTNRNELSLMRGPLDGDCLGQLGNATVLDFSIVPGGLSRIRFAILQGCLTLNNPGPYSGIGSQMLNAGAQVVLGFTSEIQFGGSNGLTGESFGNPGVAYRPGSDLWAHSFWSSFAVPGVTIQEAAARATRDLVATYGQDYGYGSASVVHQPGAQMTLARS